MTIHKGDIVIVPFPFTDLSNTKIRPAIAVTDQMRKDVVLCQITSKSATDTHSVELTDADMSSGRLERDSLVRVNKLFTIQASEILKVIGSVNPVKLEQINTHLIHMFRN